jgi:hypothetical protein
LRQSWSKLLRAMGRVFPSTPCSFRGLAAGREPGIHKYGPDQLRSL